MFIFFFIFAPGLKELRILALMVIFLMIVIAAHLLQLLEDGKINFLNKLIYKSDQIQFMDFIYLMIIPIPNQIILHTWVGYPTT